jgi:hypothetical protein
MDSYILTLSCIVGLMVVVGIVPFVIGYFATLRNACLGERIKDV